MKCPQCDTRILNFRVYDTGSSGSPIDDDKDYAHNVWLCDECGTVVVDRVWCDAGLTIVYPDGKVECRPKTEPVEHTGE